MENEISVERSDLKFKDEFGNENVDLFNSLADLKYFSEMVLKTKFSVYALTGTWGTGKTSFIKMFKNIAEHNGKNCLYIDAFENDYRTEPFDMIIKSFAKFLKKDAEKIDGTKRADFFEKARKIAFSTGKVAVKFGLGLLLNKLVSTNTQELKEISEGLKDDFIDDFDYEKQENDNIYEKFQLATKELIEATGEIVVIVDELDRCRPDFALETIEKIKHIFAVDGLKFILVYNQDVMNSIIHRVYGMGTKSGHYLSKFIEKQYALPDARSYATWLENCCGKLKDKGIDENICTIIAYRITDIAKLMVKYKIPPREMERIICNAPILYNDGKFFLPNDGGYLSVLRIIYDFFSFVQPKEAEDLFMYMLDKNNKLVNYKNNISVFYDLEKNLLATGDDEKLEQTLRNYVNWRIVHS